MLAGGWWAGGRSGIHYGWGGLYHTLPNNHLLLKAAGIYVMNIEEAREYGFQCGAEEDGSIIGSAEHVLGGGMSGRHHGLSNTNSSSRSQLPFDNIMFRLKYYFIHCTIQALTLPKEELPFDNKSSSAVL